MDSTLPAPAAARRRLGHRDFVIASASRFIGSAGYGAVVVAILLHLQSSIPGQSGVWAVTVYLLLSTLPTVLLAPWAGRLADTVDSRILATAASLASVLVLAAMALSMRLWDNFVPALFVLTVVLEAALAVASPTWQALLPRIVGEEATPRAMGTMQATLMLAQLVGPAVGGVLVGQGGTDLVFWLAGGCYLVLSAGALAIRTRRHSIPKSSAKDGRPTRPRLFDGLRVLNADSLLWSLTLGALFAVLAAEALNVLDIFLATRTFGASATQYGLLSATMGAGLIAGSLAVGQIRREKVRLLAFLGCLGLAALTILAMGLAPTLAVLFGINALAGAAIGGLNAAFGALIMLRTPEHQRGQVSAIVLGLTRSASIGALGLGGVLGSLFEPRTGFIICGTASTLVTLVLALVVAAQQSRAQSHVNASSAGPAIPDSAGKQKAFQD